MNNLSNPAPPRAAYVHIPFCVSKCHYCDFSSFPGMEALYDEYMRALIVEIERTAAGASSATGLDSVYFGGGTPTVLSIDQLSAVLSTIGSAFRLDPDCEVTLEANPGTVDESKLAQLRHTGFNRVSLGVQSLDDEFLSTTGRAHNASQATDAYHWSRAAGFANVGIDLIFALPGQTLAHWERTLDSAIELWPEHISLYELSIEEGTRFAELCARGLLTLPDEDVRLDMYEAAINHLTQAGYEHYEVSNFARPGFWSRHNQVYWRNESYHGFGAGATSYVGGCRSRRIADPRAYVDAITCGSDAIEFAEHLAGREALAETIIQGLRMLDGIDMLRLTATTGTDVLREFGDEIDNLTRRGLVALANNRLRVTHHGLLLLNDVSMEFICSGRSEDASPPRDCEGGA